jgi:Eco57I restriction-modification methylase
MVWYDCAYNKPIDVEHLHQISHTAQVYSMAIRKMQLKPTHFTASTQMVARNYKRFFEQYQTEYSNFLTHIDGILDQDDLNRYASLMLTRLMFLYFLQHRHFLDNDPHYLSHHLKIFQNCGEPSDLNFYHGFLLGILFKGLSYPNHSTHFSAIAGNIPFLDIDLFKEHQIESNNISIQISNEAFEDIFTFFDMYYWQLDGQASPCENAITPDIFVYIFERRINQKQMGAFYTQGDITAYIAKSTIIPFLFNTVEKKCPGTFQGNRVVWQQLKGDPDRYIYPAIKKGIELALPPEIEEGLHDVSRRDNWNRPAQNVYALPTETWREVIARRQHFQQIRLRSGADNPLSIDDLVIYNLDICRFVQDVIESCEDHKTIQAFYESILELSVLDPTCGTGAFLFAALDILEPIYIACLDRLEQMKPFNGSGVLNTQYSTLEPEVYFFRQEYSKHPNRRYAILKSLVTSNLYGVDIMEEAIEICRLRLFLKLLANLVRTEEIEPLPNLSSNIRIGNALAGSCKRPSGLTSDPEICLWEHDPTDFVQGDPTWSFGGAAGDHKGPPSHSAPPSPLQEGGFFQNDGEQAFHWFREFDTIMKKGGFDVIIGNPPYIEAERVFHSHQVANFTTSSTGNLYAFIMERCASLLASGGRFGMIVPASATSTDGYLPLQQILLEQSSLYISSFSDQRGKLFDIPHPRLCIIFYQKHPELKRVFSTPYFKPEWKLREFLFQRLAFVEITKQVRTGIIPRYGSPIEQTLHAKLHKQLKHLGDYLCKTGTQTVFFTRKLSWFVQVTPFIPRIIDAHGRLRKPSELKTLRFSSRVLADIVFVTLNSNLFYWFLTTRSDCRNLNMREVQGFPMNIDEMAHMIQNDLQNLAHLLAKELLANSEMRRMRFKDIGELTIQCIFPGKSKAIIDEIDRALAKHYGFTDEELDFIMNYDINYRMGRSSK